MLKHLGDACFVNLTTPRFSLLDFFSLFISSLLFSEASSLQLSASMVFSRDLIILIKTTKSGFEMYLDIKDDASSLDDTDIVKIVKIDEMTLQSFL